MYIHINSNDKICLVQCLPYNKDISMLPYQKHQFIFKLTKN